MRSDIGFERSGKVFSKPAERVGEVGQSVPESQVFSDFEESVLGVADSCQRGFARIGYRLSSLRCDIGGLAELILRPPHAHNIAEEPILGLV
ncbi:hypothetical protein A5792_06910 [Mycolicibacterium peregrinum]|uniref:Uncharacterized protein n=1 Tax=Mycolicibacterium peregrinum TaxID=43304 RepID=A0A1A0QL49_MYCPR|nr:hypothetical protein A5792_06910 [Mycolicibacterium peregrinum]